MAKIKFSKLPTFAGKTWRVYRLPIGHPLNRYNYVVALAVYKEMAKNGNFLCTRGNFIADRRAIDEGTIDLVQPIRQFVVTPIESGVYLSKTGEIMRFWPVALQQRTEKEIIRIVRAAGYKTGNLDAPLGNKWKFYSIYPWIDGNTLNNIRMTHKVAVDVWKAIRTFFKLGYVHHDLELSNVMYGTIKNSSNKRAFIIDIDQVEHRPNLAMTDRTRDLRRWMNWMMFVNHPDCKIFRRTLYPALCNMLCP